TMYSPFQVVIILLGPRSETHRQVAKSAKAGQEDGRLRQNRRNRRGLLLLISSSPCLVFLVRSWRSWRLGGSTLHLNPSAGSSTSTRRMLTRLARKTITSTAAALPSRMCQVM